MDLTDNIKSLQRKYLTSCKSLSDQNFDSGEEGLFQHALDDTVEYRARRQSHHTLECLTEGRRVPRRCSCGEGRRRHG